MIVPRSFPVLAQLSALFLSFAPQGVIAVGDEKHAAGLIKWLESEGGYFNPKLEMRHSDPSDPTSSFGVFAKEEIPSKDLLFEIPYSVIIDSGEESPELVPMVCGTVRQLAKELKLKDESKYAPYVNYILDTQKPGQIPSAWSPAGKKLLVRVLTSGEKELPPEYPIEWIEDDWYQECDGSDDPMEEYAALLAVQRGWDDLMIPFYDLINHRNGHFMNTESNNVHHDRSIPVSVKASRAIKAGEEIYGSYNLCEDCEARFTTYGAPEILRDYGFVEKFPQTWILPSVDAKFRVDEVYDKDKVGTGEFVIVEWIEEPDEDSAEELTELLEQITETQEIYLETRDKKVPEHEFNTIKDFINAMAFAIEVAIDNLENSDHGLECSDEGTCNISSLDRYDFELDTRQMTFWDDIGTEWPTCNDDVEMGKYDDGTFETLEEIQSPYQHITFMMNPDGNDTCFDLEGTVQICDSYRPHYHELSVHNAARYLKSIKRVLWVGGGDSMLLHEFLKYPELELAVGLELDQRVTRGSFKHFGTQPHFEDERVEWWFGDATKSLMMLPKDYFGSFDLVVVDLSETVMSFKVTEELDIVEALSLLLKPSGIFLKNEFYYQHFRHAFPYSVQLHWYDNPVICSQAMVMGSWLVDFMNADLFDHGVEGHLIGPLADVEDPYHLYHDYSHNYTSRNLCDVMLADEKSDKSTTQTSSPGTILIVEAEDASIDLSSPALEGTLTSTLEKQGLTVKSTTVSKADDSSIFSFILEEGYVIARSMPDKKYCAFDIHFWTKLGEQQAVRDALIAAVGSKESSLTNYRIIAGGMFGLPSWEEDEKIRGPQYKEICKMFDDEVKIEEDLNNKKLGGLDQDFLSSIIAEGVSVIPGEGKAVVVLTGDAQASSGTVIALENLDSVEEVDVLDCPSMVKFNEFNEGALEAAAACEHHLKKFLSDIDEDEKIDALVLDSTVDKFTASIFLKVLSSRRKKLVKTAFEPDAIIVSLLMDNQEKWRRNLLQLIKTDIFHYDPASYSEVLVKKGDGLVKLLLTSQKTSGFVQLLDNSVNNLNGKNGIFAEVQLIDGGSFVYQPDPFQPTHHFLPADFDQVPSLNQWNSQEPLGYQIIFQMEPKMSRATLTMNNLREILQIAISEVELPGLEVTDDTIKEYAGTGDGCVFEVLWSKGSIIVLWDGRKHVDVNYFVYEEDRDLAKSFENKFQKNKRQMLKTMLRDEQPRGIGRVVSYYSDIEDGEHPHWGY